jgi:hypothetical protein
MPRIKDFSTSRSCNRQQPEFPIPHSPQVRWHDAQICTRRLRACHPLRFDLFSISSRRQSRTIRSAGRCRPQRVQTVDGKDRVP